MTDWTMLNWWRILPCIFSLGNRTILPFCFFMFFMRLRSCIYAPAADCLNTKHVTTTGAPVRCPDSKNHRVFACAGSIRTMNLGFGTLRRDGCRLQLPTHLVSAAAEVSAAVLGHRHVLPRRLACCPGAE